ncbi:MAG: methyltransferase domain-containing protein [Phycisphaeraceae bacterium]|nr:methyltransferase domain-containing protein [Phycisphaeraceae bacterium]
MCTACSVIDPARQNAFADRILEMFNGGMIAMMMSLGHRAGLFDLLADGAARTSGQLAEEAGLHERPVREWLGAMTVARIVERDPAAGTHRLPPEHATWLSRRNPTSNLAVYAQYLPALGAAEDAVLAAFQHGRGVPYSAFPRFHEVMAEDSGQTTVPIIVDQLVPLMPGLHDRLVDGIDVLDIGCGRGRALLTLARAYPRSRFAGYELDADAVNRAASSAREEGLGNVRFAQHDLTEWDEPSAFDWVIALDAIHDQKRPDHVLHAVGRTLRPGGVFLMQDIDLNSEPVENLDHPLSPMMYGISTMHCMNVSLAQGGLGLGAAWGTQLAEKMLREAGFNRIDIHRFGHDPMNAYFICRMPAQ